LLFKDGRIYEGQKIEPLIALIHDGITTYFPAIPAYRELKTSAIIVQSELTIRIED
jgi:hypothetical protein